MLPERIAIVGKPGAGKSTLAQRLSAILDPSTGVPHIELDALYWNANWTPVDTALFRARTEALIPSAGRWITDGGYPEVRELVWGRADTVIWLDLPLHVTMLRLFLRIWSRWWHGVVLWQDNRERLRDNFAGFGETNLFRIALSAHSREQKEYPEALRGYSHLNVLRFKRTRDLEAWMRSLALEQQQQRRRRRRRRNSQPTKVELRLEVQEIVL